MPNTNPELLAAEQYEPLEDQEEAYAVEDQIHDPGFVEVAPEAADRPEPSTRSTYRQTLHLRFRVGDQLFDRRVDPATFRVKSARLKVIAAIGQASDFELTDDQYPDYLTRLVNKGSLPEYHLSIGQIRRHARAAVKAGLASNGGVRYRLTEAAYEKLESELSLWHSRNRKAKAEPSQEVSEAEVAEPEVALEPLQIEPASLPRSSDGGLDADQHEINQAQVGQIGHRQLEILAELEVAGGVIKGKSLTAAILERTEEIADTSIYTKPLKSLVDNGWAEINGVKDELVLTEAGVALIALAKAYPGELKEKVSEKVKAGSGLRLLEAIADVLLIDQDIAAKADELPEVWFTTGGNLGELSSYIGSLVGLNPPAAERRLRSLKDMGLLQFDYENYDGTANDDLAWNEHRVKICITPRGFQYMYRTHEGLRAREQVLDEAEVDVVQNSIDQSLAQAEALGDVDLEQELRGRFGRGSLFELKPDKFMEVKEYLDRVGDRLRAQEARELIEACLNLAHSLGRTKLVRDLHNQRHALFGEESIDASEHAQLSRLFGELRSDYAESAKLALAA